MFGIETNLVIKSLPALWLNHSLLFDCPLVKTSIFELAYSSIAEVETSPLDILSISCNKFVKSTDDGFEIECKKFLSNSIVPYLFLQFVTP
jgi:hypothetical protein